MHESPRTIEKWRVAFGAKRLDEIGKRTEEMDEMLFVATDETINQIFGEVGAEFIRDFLESKCHLKMQEIVDRPEVFSAGLKRILESGAIVIEKLILKNLYSRLSLKFECKEGYEFSDYIRELKGKVRLINE